MINPNKNTKKYDALILPDRAKSIFENLVSCVITKRQYVSAGLL